MKVFISWSGSLSHLVASSLNDWLPLVIQALDPFLASEDISKGERWLGRLSSELESQAYGILVLTSNNLREPWINFEAGALSKSLNESRVVPLLIGLKSSDVPQTLAQFQGVEFHKEDMRKMMHDLNTALGAERLRESVLDNTFDTFWPQLEESVSQAIHEDKEGSGGSEEPIRSDRELLEEILDLVRAQERQGRVTNDGISDRIGEDLAQYWLALLRLTRGIDQPPYISRNDLLDALRPLNVPIRYILMNYFGMVSTAVTSGRLIAAEGDLQDSSNRFEDEDLDDVPF